MPDLILIDRNDGGLIRRVRINDYSSEQAAWSYMRDQLGNWDHVAQGNGWNLAIEMVESNS